MTPAPPDFQSESYASDVRRYLEQPKAWAHVSQGLQRIALAIVGDDRDAEDIVQGAWLEMLMHPTQRQSHAWLKRLVRFRALDALRRKRRSPMALEGEHQDPPESVDLRWKLEAQREVLDAVKSLKEPYQSTVLLRYFEGKGPKAIAELVGVPERTIKTRLTRAHEMLREKLGARCRDRFGNWTPALLAFSGHPKIQVSSAILPTTSALLMKKAILIGVALAVTLWIPLAWQRKGIGDEGLSQTVKHEADLVGEVSLSEVLKPAQREQQGLPETNIAAKPEMATFEYAFPPRLAAEVGKLTVRARWSDGTGAQNLKLQIMPWGAGDAFLLSRTYYTDSLGFAEIDQLPPGKVEVFPSRGKSRSVQVAAGETVPMELEVPTGVTLRGQVLNPKGQPIAGAQVFLADSAGGDTQTQASAISDRLGQYEIRDARPHDFLSARAAGYSPSLQTEIGGPIGSVVAVDLHLNGNPGTLRGVALSPAGLPVVGAKIRIEVRGLDTDHGRSDPDSRWPLAFELRTDAEGRFESDQVGVGTMRVIARTETWQPWQQVIEVGPHEPEALSIRFEAGAMLTGTVTTENGQPLAKVAVFSGTPLEHNLFRAETDVHGTFRLQGLPPNRSEVQFFRKGFEERHVPLVLRLGSPNELTVVLKELDSARGVVLDSAGAPLNRWLVAIDEPNGNLITSAWTDAEGRFELLGVPEGSSGLLICTEDFWKSGSGFRLESVLPAKGPLRIVVPDSAHPRSSVHLKVLVDGEPAPQATQIRLRSDSRILHREAFPDAQGGVLMEGLASREYELEVCLTGYAPLQQRFRLGVNEALDLGTLVLESGGYVEVLLLATDPPQGPHEVHLLDDRGKPLQSMELTGPSGLFGPLPAGTRTLRFNSERGASQFADVQIVNGETTRVSVTFQPGTKRTLLWTHKKGVPIPHATTIRVLDALGHIHFYSKDVQQQDRGNGVASIQLPGLTIGKYTVQMQRPNGPIHETWFQVNTLDPEEQDSVTLTFDW